jgi:hypothetical protein
VIDVVFGLAIAIAQDDAGERVVDDAWIAAQTEEANRLFSPLGIRFRWTIEKPLPEPHGEMHSRSDRDALSALTERGVVNVFLVRALEDVDEPGRMRMGVCWTSRTDKQRYLVVSRSARPSVLAHELGHLFGNGHSTVTNNLMSYSRDGDTVFLDDAQKKTIGAFAGRFLGSGHLFDVGPPRRIF